MALNQTHLQLALALALVLALALAGSARAQNCSCASNLCCSQFGYCGTGDAYCGTTCQAGLCYSNASSSGGSLLSFVTDAFFNGIIAQAASTCAGKTFYTRSAFLTAAESYPRFGTTGSQDVAKREIAAFFAHVTYQTGYFCYIEEVNGASNNLCAQSTQWPCNPSKKYYGRGPLQISWNFNYGPAGQSIGFDGLNSPETVADDPVISFKTAFWIWLSENAHSIITTGQGFGATIRALNSIECNGGNNSSVTEKIKLYTQYCQQLGVSPGDNLSC